MSKIIRKERNRFKIKANAKSDRLRLSVFRSCNHLYAQIIKDGDVLFQVSSSAKNCPVYSSSKKEKAMWVGKTIAEKSIEKIGENGKKVYFDRGGYAYHGLIKILANSARESGLEF